MLGVMNRGGLDAIGPMRISCCVVRDIKLLEGTL